MKRHRLIMDDYVPTGMDERIADIRRRTGKINRRARHESKVTVQILKSREKDS